MRITQSFPLHGSGMDGPRADQDITVHYRRERESESVKRVCVHHNACVCVYHSTSQERVCVYIIMHVCVCVCVYHSTSQERVCVCPP